LNKNLSKFLMHLENDFKNSFWCQKVKISSCSSSIKIFNASRK
jgi:hypothetical protein